MANGATESTSRRSSIAVGGASLWPSPKDEIEYAVQAERERLTAHFNTRISEERIAKENEHRQECDRIKSSMDKQIRKLDQGLRTVLQETSVQHTNLYAPRVVMLQHQLLLKTALNHLISSH